MSQQDDVSMSELPSDHPMSGSEGPNRMRQALRRRGADRTPYDLVRQDLAAATRRITNELVSTTASEGAIAEAAELVARAAEVLAGEAHGRPYEGPAEGSLEGGRNLFIDHSPFIGMMNPLSPPMTVEVHDDRVIGRVVYGTAYEGPPGCLHGGFVAAGFDEVLGFTQSLTGRAGMTGRLEISYRSPTPLYSEVVYTGWIDRVEGRKIYTGATLRHGETLCAEAMGLFITMKPEVFERLMELRGITPERP